LKNAFFKLCPELRTCLRTSPHTDAHKLFTFCKVIGHFQPLYIRFQNSIICHFSHCFILEFLFKLQDFTVVFDQNKFEKTKCVLQNLFVISPKNVLLFKKHFKFEKYYSIQIGIKTHPWMIFWWQILGRLWELKKKLTKYNFIWHKPFKVCWSEYVHFGQFLTIWLHVWIFYQNSKNSDYIQ
jgi:hypothetical protein